MNVRKKDYPDAPDVGDMAHGWRARDHPVTGRKHVNRAKQMLQNVQGKRKDEKKAKKDRKDHRIDAGSDPGTDRNVWRFARGTGRGDGTGKCSGRDHDP